MSRIVITGAAGFIRSHLSEALPDRGHSDDC
jgi:nucleoside-diphosphate-sugar epimerase